VLAMAIASEVASQAADTTLVLLDAFGPANLSVGNTTDHMTVRVAVRTVAGAPVTVRSSASSDLPSPHPYLLLDMPPSPDSHTASSTVSARIFLSPSWLNATYASTVHVARPAVRERLVAVVADKDEESVTKA
jgi:hypothetical protein